MCQMIKIVQIQENIISFKRIKDLNSWGTFSEQQDGEEVTIIKKEDQPTQEITQSQYRYYNLYITYDLYYITPLLYLSGKVDDRQQSYQEVKEKQFNLIYLLGCLGRVC
ncbi:unnamed protein product (macronuclear) [Paramecium tetraurelia]|uniref:Uncharacterized protein n=1 Tax=Paramecium tetraurelia TaxID=5888 RepID=A0EIE3_PARTE|nr:uncharacterized protein GSPATT00027413001 [Paramecium tetraurelia]CAK95084.1 unnamed protein product [Paramecium tetraurelia]|eukprot:XP_001462457.1 hypothetical protein (macronuclear) [Paramecium tetraurelia strain d4-2]